MLIDIIDQETYKGLSLGSVVSVVLVSLIFSCLMAFKNLSRKVQPLQVYHNHQDRSTIWKLTSIT